MIAYFARLLGLRCSQQYRIPHATRIALSGAITVQKGKR